MNFRDSKLFAAKRTQYGAAILLVTATLAIPPATQANVLGPGLPHGLSTDVIKVEDPEPLPDRPATQQRLTPRDRVTQPAPAMRDRSTSQQAPRTAPKAIGSQPTVTPDIQKKTLGDTPK